MDQLPGSGKRLMTSLAVLIVVFALSASDLLEGECESDGLHAMFDCEEQYYLCVGGKKRIADCQDPLVFDNQKKECVSKEACDRGGRKSEQDEYSPMPESVDAQGAQPPASDFNGARRIEQAEDRAYGEYMSYVDIWFARATIAFAPDQHICGGIAIDEDWILTAAHCVTYGSRWWHLYERSNLWYYAFTDVKSAGSGIRHKVEEVVIHKDYRGYLGKKEPCPNCNDIALLRVTPKIPARFVALVDDGKSGKYKSCVNAALHSFPDSDVYGGLAKLSITLHSDDDCVTWHGLKNRKEAYDAKMMICGKPPKITSGVLPGDSGSGIYCDQDNGQIVVGIQSHKYKLENETSYRNGLQEVYTRVSYYGDWIKRIVQGPHHHGHTWQ